MAKFEFTDSGSAANKAFLGDYGDREHVLAGGMKLDPDAVYGSAGEFTIKVNDADVNAGETAITVDALPVALPDNTELMFGNQRVKLSAAAAAGATSITVDALIADIADDATATYDPDADTKIVLAGTVLGQTFTEKEAGTAIGPAADADDEVFITFNEVDADKSDDVDVLRHGTLIKVNFLPAWSGLSAAVKALVREQYQTQLG